MKIIKPEDLCAWCSRDRKGLVMTNGCFDVLHYGHIRHLIQAKTSGTRLLVAVDTDERVRMLKGESRPVNTLERRLYSLAALECVDGVIAFDDLPRLIRIANPSIYTKSGYRLEDFHPAEAKALADCETDIRLIPLEPNISTTKILNHETQRPH
jgi:D-beta-D-heptose 7-phosphate kinase/D-beta-D-heptose 1-phosphate adenosyltransferase